MKFWSKTEILFKKEAFGQILKCWSEIKMLVKFWSKSEILSYGQKFIFF